MGLKKVFRKIGKGLKKGAGVILPAVGTFLGGPVGGAIGAAVGGALTKTFGKNTVTEGIGSLVGNVATSFIENAFTPDPATPPPVNYNSQAPASSATGSGGFTDGVNFIKGMETPIKPAAEQGADTREYLANAYPELNPWERSGAGGTMFGSDMTGAVQDQEQANKQLAMNAALQGIQIEKELALAKLQSDTALAVNINNNATSERVAGIASQTSRMNTKDQVGIAQQNVELSKQRLSSDVQKIAADTSLSEQSRKESIAREINTYAQTNNIKLSGDQIKALTNQALQNVRESSVRTESEKIKQKGYEQDNLNKRYGQGHIMQDIFSGSNVLNDIGVGLSDAWNSLWSKSDGVSGAMGSD